MLLIETNLSPKLKLLNEEQKDKPLKFRGIFAKLDHKTENGRVYSKDLWEKCIESTSVQERLRKRQMLGELKHPDYRDIDIEKSAFIITKLWIEDGYVMGEAEIMPHPTLGGILEVFVRAGCQVGISSRGEGSIVEKSGDSHVDPRDFELITFDTTLNPAVTEAQPKMVRESIHNGLESLKEKCSVSQLRRVISVTENSINTNESKMKNTEDSSDSFSKGMKIGKIVEKLKEKMQLNLQLSKENAGLKTQLESSNLQVNSLKNLNEKLISKAETLMESYSKLKEDFENSSALRESKQEQSSILKKEYNSLKEKYNKSLDLVSTLMESLDLYEGKLQDSDSTLEQMKSSIIEMEEREIEAENRLRQLKEKTISVGSEKKELRTEKEELLNEKVELEEEYTNSLSKNKSLAKSVRQLQEQTKNFETKLHRMTRVNSDLESKNQELTALLREARIALKKNAKKDKPEDTSSLNEESKGNIDEIKNGVLHNNPLNSRTSKVTNQSSQNINESNEDDSTSEIMNKMMF